VPSCIPPTAGHDRAAGTYRTRSAVLVDGPVCWVGVLTAPNSQSATGTRAAAPHHRPP